MAENNESLYNDSTKTLDFRPVAKILAFSKTFEEISYTDKIIIDGIKYNLEMKITPHKEDNKDDK